MWYVVGQAASGRRFVIAATTRGREHAFDILNALRQAEEDYAIAMGYHSPHYRYRYRIHDKHPSEAKR